MRSCPSVRRPASRCSTALHSHHDSQTQIRRTRGERNVKRLFAIRNGGHSPVPGAASIKGGILVDLGQFCQVTPSEDGTSVAIGAGAKWMDVFRTFNERGLAVVRGRNSAVGVGGLTLGGNYLFVALLLSFALVASQKPVSSSVTPLFQS